MWTHLHLVRCICRQSTHTHTHTHAHFLSVWIFKPFTCQCLTLNTKHRLPMPCDWPDYELKKFVSNIPCAEGCGFKFRRTSNFLSLWIFKPFFCQWLTLTTKHTQNICMHAPIRRNLFEMCVCVCMCVYIYIYIYTVLIASVIQKYKCSMFIISNSNLTKIIAWLCSCWREEQDHTTTECSICCFQL